MMGPRPRRGFVCLESRVDVVGGEEEGECVSLETVEE